VYVHIEENRIN